MVRIPAPNICTPFSDLQNSLPQKYMPLTTPLQPGRRVGRARDEQRYHDWDKGRLGDAFCACLCTRIPHRAASVGGLRRLTIPLKASNCLDIRNSSSTLAARPLPNMIQGKASQGELQKSFNITNDFTTEIESGFSWGTNGHKVDNFGGAACQTHCLGGGLQLLTNRRILFRCSLQRAI